MAARYDDAMEAAFRPARLLLALGALLGCVPALAAPQPVELRDFFERVVPPLLEDHGVPGLSLAVVADGELVLATGFGAARLDPDVPATGATPFATGSVSKLLTWTAVMQQVEAGALDLDRDINDYLRQQAPFTIPPGPYGAITLRHLLTHTPGFEDHPVVGLFAASGERLRDLETELADNVPARVQSPGTEAAYSNYGTALAGYLVQLTSGIPFEEYIEQNILLPLGMTASTFRQPYPPGLESVVAYQYVAGDAAFELTNRDYVPLSPAGGLIMSAEDAARFMLMYLAEGSAGPEAAVLRPETVAAMRQPLHRHHPDLPGNAYGFWESDRHDRFIIGHNGDTNASHTLLALLPDENLGVYFSTNSPGGVVLREALWGAFLDTFYPVAAPVPVDDGDLTRYEGTYLSNRYSARTFAKVVLLLSGMTVRAEGGALVTPSLYGTGEMRWVPQGNGWFVDAETDTRVWFASDGAGHVRSLYFSDIPMMAFHRAAWHQQPLLHVVTVGAALLLFLSAVITLLIVYFRRRRGLDGPWWPLALAWLMSVAALGFASLLVMAVQDPNSVLYGVEPRLVVALTLGIAVAILVLGVLGSTIAAFVRGWWSRGLRVYAAVLSLAGLAFTAFMAYWNLLGYRY